MSQFTKMFSFAKISKYGTFKFKDFQGPGIFFSKFKDFRGLLKDPMNPVYYTHIYKNA